MQPEGKLVSYAGRVRRALVDYVGVGGMLVILILWFSWTQPHFATVENLILIIEGNVVLLIISLGLTFVLLMGMFDLSIGGILVLSGVSMALLLQHDVPTGVAITAVIVGGLLFGALVNGLPIAKLGLSFFVMTLGTMSIARGSALVVTEGQTQPLYTEKFLRTIGSGRWHNVPWSVMVAFFLFIVALFVARYTGFGRMLYAIGGNPEAARLAGINVTLVRVIVFSLSGGFAALAGVIDTGRLGAAAPDGQVGIELLAAAAVLLGGTSFHGGAGGMFRTFMGVAFLGVLSNGLTISGVSSFWNPVITGGVLILAVTLDLLRERSILGGVGLTQKRNIDRDTPPESLSTTS